MSPLYDASSKFFLAMTAFSAPTTVFIDAPFGRFTPKTPSVFLVNGIRSWIVMELVSPAMLLYTYAKRLPSSPFAPSNLLVALFMAHYLNRAIISPLRTPSRSKTHIIVPIMGIIFNIFNGGLLGTYLSGPGAAYHLQGAYSRPVFWLGLVAWAVGFAGNILHDEVLLNLRRKPKKPTDRNDEPSKSKPKPSPGEHYAIPRGYLYRLISFPNYLCEWFEWSGFAIAAAPVPSFSVLGLSAKLAWQWKGGFPTLDVIRDFVFNSPFPHAIDGVAATKQVPHLALPDLQPFLVNPRQALEAAAYPVSFTLNAFLSTLTPPFIFAIAEVLTMTPRAWKGHKWYKERFGAEYPAERKAVIPFVL